MKNQFGRSMIEILGVLAIIGVLSIGGVATFQYAMTKDKANKVIYDINLLREQTLTNAADVPAENFEPESGYQMSSQYGEGGIVSIMIDDLDKDVCERLLSMRFEDLRFLHAEQNTDILSCEGTPSFRAVFGLGDNAIIDEDACVIPCEDNHECHERRCCPKLTEGQCSATASGCPTQVAEDGTPCGTNQVCDDGECICGLECGGEFVPNSACDACECGLECDNGGTPNESCTACENCANSYGGTYCDVCEQDCQNSGTPIQNCSACDCANSWEGDNCETCNLTCQNDGTANEDCSACECPSNRTGGNCETCANSWTGDNCEICNLTNEYCKLTGKVLDEDSCSCRCDGNWTGDNCDVCDTSTLNCGSSQNIDAENCLCVCETEGYTGYSCNYACPPVRSYTFQMSKSACEACGNTFWASGSCHGCGDLMRISYSTEAEAEACANQCAGSGYERYQNGKYCTLETEASTSCPPSSITPNMFKSVCVACGNTFWKNGDCINCNYSSTITFDTAEDAKECVSMCAGARYQSGSSCYPATNTACPSATSSTTKISKSACEACGNAFWKNGDCYGCGYSGGISFDTEAGAEECEAACAGSGYNRIAEGTYCYSATRTTCPSVTSSTSGMSKSACDACGNTFWKNGTCYGCGYSSLRVFYSTEAEAEACANQCAGTGYERGAEGTYCYSATRTTCPSATSRTYDMSKSVCEKCGNTFWDAGTCYGCGDSGAISFDTEAGAEACANQCAGSGYERIAEGTSCYSADDTTCPSATSRTYNMSKSMCEACGNTFWNNGGCYGCNYSSDISFATEAEAKECMDACAGSGYERYQYASTCRRATKTTCPSATSYTSNMSKSVCEKCGNTVYAGGSCYGCGYSYVISYSTEAEAAECMNRCAGSRYERYQTGRNCQAGANTTCPSVTSYTSKMSKSACEACGNAFWKDGGYCYSCGYSSNVTFDTEADAEACENACVGTGYERYKSERYCRLATNTTCPSATSYTSNVSKSVCEKCGNTVYAGGSCYGCGYSSSTTSLTGASSSSFVFDTLYEAESCVNACADSGYPREIDKAGDVYHCGLK